MSSLGSPNSFFLAGKKAYAVERSLRFNRSDGAYLQATLGDGNEDKWTWSGWVKKTVNGQHQNIFSSGSYNVYTHINFENSDRLRFQNWHSAQKGTKITTRLFRDNSAWMHIVVIWDSGNSTADDRMRLYINGTRETSFSSSTNPDQNQDSVINGNSLGGSTYGEGKHFVGKFANTSDNSSTYKTEINFIDGQAYDPSYFAETDVITGQWNPKKYTGSYGTNGFYLNFSDNSGTTATTLGKDSSGNGNNFTPNNFSVAAGAGNDSLEDTPTNNFCTLNSVKKDGQTTLSNGNLQASGSQSSTYNINTQGTFAQSSGKWYYEVEFTSGSGSCAVGWTRTTLRSSDNPTTGGGIVYRPTNGDYVDLAGNNPTTPPTTSTGTVIQVAIDLDAGKIWFGSGGTYFNSGDPSAGSNEAMTFTGGSELLAPAVRTMAATFNFNFGQRAFSYTVPTGYKKLNSANLPDPTIKLPNKHFAAFTYTGTGSSGDVVNITNSDVDFTPDWVWVKTRNVTNDHILSDSVRGGSKYLVSSETYAEQTNTQKIRAFIQNGFESGTDGDTNWSGGRPFVAWNWNAGDTDGKTYTVTVVSDSGNKYRFDGFGTSAVTLDLAEGGTYIFDQSDSSNAGHPLRFSTTSNGTHGGGSEYTTGVTTSGTPGSSGAFTQIVVAASAPTLYYYCTNHSGMGGQANTNSTLGSSNFDGNNQSIVKVNASAGFSILKYTGTGANSTLVSMGHGLGVKPSAVFIKNRTRVVDWVAWIDGVGGSATDNQKNLALNTNAAAGQNSSQYRTSDSTTITVRDTDSNGNNKVNRSGDNYISYVFSEVAGYSKFGSYVGNGSSSGPFLFTGFRPAWVLIKNSGAGGFDWVLQDATRSTFNVADKKLNPNTSAAEQTGNDRIDILSNGFKCRDSSAGINADNSSYIYLAFAESPFKNARAR